jgi:hypothetical protein
MELTETVLSTLATILFGGLGLYALVQWFIAVYNMFALTNEYKEGINPWSWKTGFNPFNGLICIGWLTPKGKEHAKKCWVAIAKFAVVVLSPFAFAYLFELATGVVLLGE